eukprot:4225076-Karenia_brevis.AAC.1
MIAGKVLHQQLDSLNGHSSHFLRCAIHSAQHGLSQEEVAQYNSINKKANQVKHSPISEMQGGRSWADIAANRKD